MFSTGLSTGERGGRGRRQREDGDVFRHRRLVGGVPARLIPHQHGMSGGSDLRGDLVEMPLHGLGVTAGQDESGTDTALGANGAEDIGRLGALVVRRDRTGSPFGPAPGDLVLLADPGFILPPQFYLGSGRQGGSDRCQLAGEVFLKASRASTFWA